MYLLIGCAVPLWMEHSQDTLASYAGLLIIGVGDSMVSNHFHHELTLGKASLVGSTVGSTRWPDSNKTVEGTVAAIFCVFNVAVGLSYLLKLSMTLTQVLFLLF